MYQPTEQELLDMGFAENKDYHGCVYFDFIKWKIDCDAVIIRYATEECYHPFVWVWFSLILINGYTHYNYDSKEFELIELRDKIFPRSKEHLEQIILAFKPE